jgi:hypothetical protein
MNSVKLYSNGMAVYTREYLLDGKNPTKISIPVKKPDLDEVVASIAVFGNVRLPFPPSYTPVNASTTKLTIDPSSALKDTATKLAGSVVEVTKSNGEKVGGKLVGTHPYKEWNGSGSTTERLKLVVLTEAGIVMIHENELDTLTFTEPTTRDEYLKALAASYQSIKPDSSFVDLTIVAEEGARSAAVTYATPVAAWKPRYQLRSVMGVWELQSEAVVDNDTDDEWKDSTISVITGEPISFETDLAEIRRPARSRVNVVADQAQGAVGVEDTVSRKAAKMLRSRGMALASAPMMESRKDSMADFDEEVHAMDLSTRIMLFDQQAQGQEAEVRESGDFSIFTSPTAVTIGSKKSALIPMFRAIFHEAKTVLVYNPNNNPQRPFRAIKVKNETKNPLGKGVCEIYLDGDFQGKAILEATSPGQEAFLVHAKETGVKVHAAFSAIENRRVGIRIKDGVAVCEEASRTTTTYSVTNNKNEPFEFEIEHSRRLVHSKAAVETSEGEALVSEIPSGWRISIKLPANSGPQTGEIEVVVTENSLESQAFQFVHQGAAWLQQQIIAVKNPLARNQGIVNVIRLQEKVDELNHQIQQAEQQEQTLHADQERLLKLIPSGHADQANKWRTELGTIETDLRELSRKTLPDLRAKQREATKAVQEALANLTGNWSEETKGLSGEKV